MIVQFTVFTSTKSFFCIILQYYTITATIKEDVEVMLLAHYLHQGRNNVDYVDKVQSLMPCMMRKTASGAEYLVRVMLNQGGEKDLRKASLMLSSSRTYGYEYFVVDEQAL